jgi:hypothetical protein
VPGGCVDTVHSEPGYPLRGGDVEERVLACARKVHARWRNRDKVEWCAYCGKPEAGSKWTCVADAGSRQSGIAAKSIRRLTGSYIG